MAFTNSFPQFPITVTDDPRTTLFAPKSYNIKKSGKQQTYQIYPANSYSSSNITINCPPNNKNMILNRDPLIHIVMDVKFTGALPLIGVTDSLRQFPFASICTTANARINGSNVSVLTSELVHPLMRFAQSRKNRTNQSFTPSMADSYQNYSDSALYGSARDPLAQWGAVGQEVSRGGYPYVDLGGGVYRFDIYEPLYLLSPFEFSTDTAHTGLINVNSLEFQFLLGDLSRVWSHSSLGGAITGVSVTFASVPELLFLSITSQDTTPLPASMTYPYDPINRFITNVGTVAPGAQYTVTSQNVQLGAIPKRVFIWARRRIQDWDFKTSDSFAYIKNVSLQWNNQSALLSTARDVDLYRISVTNGFTQDGGWPAAKAYSGYILALDPSLDLSLGPMEAVGLQENFQFTATVTFVNINSQAVNYDLTICTVDDGLCTINSNGSSMMQTGILTKEAILSSLSAPKIDYRDLKLLEGGNLFSRLKSFVHTPAKVVGDIARGVASAAPYVSRGADALAELTAEGLSGGRMRRRAKRRHKKRRGFGLIGGDLNESTDESSDESARLSELVL
jgi:hypothetical protein